MPKFYFLGALIVFYFLGQSDTRRLLSFKFKFNIVKAQFAKAVLACQTECWNRPNFKIYQWKISIDENIIIIIIKTISITALSSKPTKRTSRGFQNFTKKGMQLRSLWNWHFQFCQAASRSLFWELGPCRDHFCHLGPNSVGSLFSYLKKKSFIHLGGIFEFFG